MELCQKMWAFKKDFFLILTIYEGAVLLHTKYMKQFLVYTLQRSHSCPAQFPLSEEISQAYQFGDQLWHHFFFQQVNPSPFYDACVHDACSCDSGGDCDCFCSAVAAYAQECTKAQACVFWRSPDICRE